MATFFERITGVNLDPDIDSRIPIAAVIAMLRELHRGEATAQQIITEFSLNSSQQTALTFIYTKISTSTDPDSSLNVLEDWLNLAEVSNHKEYRGGAMAAKYQTEANLIARLNSLG